MLATRIVQKEGTFYFAAVKAAELLEKVRFFSRKHPETAKAVDVPCVLFDGKSAAFATEMFVIINSTHTRINKSHLVDLYERVSWETPEKKLAAKVVNLLYDETDSPLRYRINRLGGRGPPGEGGLPSGMFNERYKKGVEKRKNFYQEFPF